MEDRRLLATVTVNTELDSVDFNDGLTSLREALFATNLVAGPDTINFDFGHDGPATIRLTQGELRITDDLTIDGPGAELLTIDASGNDPTPDLDNGDGSRVFNVDDAQASSRIEATITGLRLVGGDVAADGGAILNRENLTVANSVVEGNAAVAASPAGGGIYSAASLVIENSRIFDNVAYGRSTRGGGVAALDGLTIRNSEISGNRSGVGGVYSRSLLTSDTSVVNSTISGNSGGGLVINSIGRPIEIVGTKITDNTSIAENTSALGLRITTRNGAAVLISHSTISGHTGGSGLRLVLYSGSTATIRDSDFIGNVAAFNNGGGASIGAATGTVTIDRCNFIENTAPGGGGLFATGNVQVSNSVFRGNLANAGIQAAGGGIFIGGEFGATAQVAIRNSVIEANSASSTGVNRGHGGGIFSRLRFDLIESTVTGNSATGSGGGIYSTVPGSTILRSTVRGNSAGEDGGGIAAKSGSRAVGFLVTDSSIGMNTAGRDGGGLFADSDDVVIAGSTIHENSAGRNGGGLRLHVDSKLTSSTLSGNSAAALGGGLWSYPNTTIAHSTITENKAAAGGGAFTANGPLTLDHSIVAGNMAPVGKDVTGTLSTFISATHSLIGSNQRTGLAPAPVGSPDLNGNIIGDGDSNIDPLLGPLADNGGPTLTHALLPGSPAINAGNLNAMAGVEGVPQFDQRGEPFARIAGGRIDIGAFELQEVSDLKLLVGTLSDELDDNYGRGDLSLREAIELANLYSSDDTIRFDPALTAAGPATILLTMGELRITDDVSVEGNGAEFLIIDATGNDPTADIDDARGSRTFNIDDGFTTHSEILISGLRLTGGDVEFTGGAVHSTESLTLRHVVVDNNAAMTAFGDGGGVYSVGPLVVENSRIANNRAGIGSTGGITALAGIAIFSSEIIGNQGSAGGVSVRGGDVDVIDTTISDNTGAGLGIEVSSHTATIMGSMISRNARGGLYLGVASGGTGRVIDTSFIDNVSGTGGGGADINVSAGGQARVERSRFHNNAAKFGGGLALKGSVQVLDSEFLGNVATFAGLGGGGVYVGETAGESPPVEIRNSLFEHNVAKGTGGGIGYGGGIHARADLDLIDCIIVDNSATGFGGGIAIEDGASSIVGSLIENNQAGIDGGGIMSSSAVSAFVLTMNASTIRGNIAGRDGGGLFAETDRVKISNSTVSGNSARNGGGLAIGRDSVVINSTISENVASGLGGGIWSDFGTALTHSTITSNSAQVAGGGAFNMAGRLELVNSIVAGNTVPVGGAGRDLTGLIGTEIIARYSLIGTNDASGLPPSPMGSPDADGNLIGSGFLINAMLGPLADNGGPTMTHALLPGSPAINAGDPAARAGVEGVPLGDQRGAQFTRVYGGRIDIGAFERQPTEFLLGDFNRNGSVDTADLILWRKANGQTDGLGNYVDSRGNADGVADQWDYSLWRANFGLRKSVSSAAAHEALPFESIEAQTAQVHEMDALRLDAPIGTPAVPPRGKPAVRARFHNGLALESNDLLIDLLADRRIVPLRQAGDSLHSPMGRDTKQLAWDAVDIALAEFIGL